MATDPAVPAALVEATDEDPASAVDLDRWVRLARSVIDGFAFGRPIEMGLHFVTEQHMTELNREHMGQDGPTDVLSFPVDGHPGAAATSTGVASTGAGEGLPVALGDVIVCTVVAARGAAAHGVTLDDELALLTIHGILHLLDWDHTDRAETAAMQAEERRLLDQHHVGAP